MRKGGKEEVMAGKVLVSAADGFSKIPKVAMTF